MEWVLPTVLVILVLVVTLISRRLSGLRRGAVSLWPALETGLRRRHDLITPLAQALRALPPRHHRAVENMVKARNAAGIAGLSPQRAGKAERTLETAMEAALVRMKDHPELQADPRITRLLPLLAALQEEITAAEADFNQAVMTYNAACLRFPEILVAKALNFWKLQYFGLGTDELEDLRESERDGTAQREPMI